MGASDLPSDYQFIDSLALPLAILSFLLVAVGSFLRRDGYPAHASVGRVAEGIGWVAMIGGQVVLAQLAAQNNVDCTLWHRCDAVDDGPLSYLWLNYLRPTLIDGAILLVADLLGWAAAKLTPRNAPKGP